MNTNVLTMLGSRVRFGLYVAYGLAGVLYYAASAAYIVDPSWLDAVGRVLQALLVPFSALAATHVTKAPSEQASEPGSLPEATDGGPNDDHVGYGTSLAEREDAD